MDVVYFGSREIYQDFYTAIRSLLAHNQNVTVYTITEDPDPFYDLPVHNMVWRYKDYFNDTNTQTKWKQFGPIRAAFTKLFPYHDKILSIDCDTIVTADISELWDFDMSDCHVAMTPEIAHDRPYWNNGICLMNLKRIREDGLDDLMIQELNTTFHRYVGQDVMQKYLRIKNLPSIYNASKFTAPCLEPKILHYADRTDWRGLSEVLKYKNH